MPLLELLEYPKDLRAEEFPVYGYEGSKSLKTKAADFLQFTSNELSMYRGKSDEELEWVYKHSLLIFEAKKPQKKQVNFIISFKLDDQTRAGEYGEMFQSDYVMAKHADSNIPDNPEEWLDAFNNFSIYQVLPSIIELWGLNVQTDEESKKTSPN